MFPTYSNTIILLCKVPTIRFSIELYLNRNSHLGKSLECWAGWYFHRCLCFSLKSKSPVYMDCRISATVCAFWVICVVHHCLGVWPRSVLLCTGGAFWHWDIAHPFILPLHPPCSSLTQNLCPHNKEIQLGNLQTPWKLLQSNLSSEKPNGASLWKCWPGELFVSCWKSCLVPTRTLTCAAFPSSLKWGELYLPYSWVRRVLMWSAALQKHKLLPQCKHCYCVMVSPYFCLCLRF